MTPSPPDGRRTIPREQDAPRWLIVLMIALMLLAVGGSFFWVRWVGLAENVVGRPAPLARDFPIFTADEILDEAARGNLLGRDVAIWRVPVQAVTGDLLFWIGTDSTRVIPVILLGEQTARQHEHATVVRRGDTIGIFGFVRAMRDLSVESELSERDRERLARAQVYVSALRVEHHSRADR